jgi:glucose/mannose transport system substrate-binding protein
LLDKAGLEIPRTWPEFLASAEVLKRRGVTPLALGGQPWQERLLFNSIVLGLGGRSFFREVYEQQSSKAFQSATMLEVFRTFGALRKYVDRGSPGRRWGATARSMIDGNAAFFIMGDWAKTEINATRQELGVHVGCALAPSKDAGYIMMVDGFAFSLSNDKAVQSGQRLFADVARSRDIQIELAKRLGSIPARSDVPVEGFDQCSRLGILVTRDADAQLLDPGLTLPAGLSGEIDDAISEFWNSPALSPEDGQALLTDIIAGSGRRHASNAS